MTRNLIIVEGASFLQIKKSKFSAFSLIVNSQNDFKKQLDIKKKEYKNATHYCFAYRIQPENGVLLEKMSDDGEPHGTAGKPILSLLEKNSIANGAIVVVRYFGGVKLGRKGLLTAYLNSAVKALKDSKMEIYVAKEIVEMKVSYSAFKLLEIEMKKFSIKMLKSEFEEDIHIKFEIKFDEKEKFLEMLSEKNLKNHIKVC
ncbi:MAG: YigZ family protein [Caldisericia bacterium]|nr:YigZ family protein [Caldisericia bacterium]